MLRWIWAIASVPLLAADPSYTKDIVPVLQKNCVGCHQAAMKSAGLDLTSFETFSKGGQKGAAFVAGDAPRSLTIRYMTGEAMPSMPMGQPKLAPEVIDIFRNWIQAGAKDDSTKIESRVGPAKYSQAPVITAMRFAPDGKTIAVSGNGEILINNIEGGIAARLPGKAERVLSIAYSKDGKTLVAGGGTPARFGEIQWWDLGTKKQLRSAELTTDTVFGASLSPDSSKVAVGCADNTVHVFDSSNAKELYKLGNHENWVLGTVFSVDGKRFVSVSRDRAAKIVDASLGQFLENANTTQKSELNAVARHPSKDIIVMGGEDRYPYVYSLDRTRNMKVGDDAMFIRRLDRQEGAITAFDWSADGKLIAVAGASPKVNIYDAETGNAIAACARHEAGIYSLAFSPDSKTLATGGFDGKVRLYSTSDCQLIKTFIPVPLEAAQ